MTWDSHVKAQEVLKSQVRQRKLRCQLQEYYETSGKKMHLLLAFPVVGKVPSPKHCLVLQGQGDNAERLQKLRNENEALVSPRERLAPALRGNTA